eukprot:CAMPEP_0175401544 /NCGR_PEP_ID=MMETSP0095-20121207/37063_1 /TAXON_ID=311494 /ORGANISM="Alexandrium monilatum, Strain CCMP3105" /LENGTH=174 /DNA_ID=CAMNT_0016700297 /DNA_START=283 /DNA_END=805 /DNA_ORIENTATION=+
MAPPTFAGIDLLALPGVAAALLRSADGLRTRAFKDDVLAPLRSQRLCAKFHDTRPCQRLAPLAHGPQFEAQASAWQGGCLCCGRCPGGCPGFRTPGCGSRRAWAPRALEVRRPHAAAALAANSQRPAVAAPAAVPPAPEAGQRPLLRGRIAAVLRGGSGLRLQIAIWNSHLCCQ